MVKIEVTTQLEFKDSEQFFNYLSSDDITKVTGFADELREAYANGKVMSVKTERPTYGVVVVSTLEVQRSD